MPNPTLEPIRRGGNLANAPLIPPYKYSDYLWLKYQSEEMGRDHQTRYLRLLVNLNKGSRLYGPFRLPFLPNNMAIVAAYCHPFRWETDFGTFNPTELEDNIIRPALAIRYKDTLELMLAPIDDVEDYGGALVGNTGIYPVVDVASARRILGDFFTDMWKDYADKGARSDDQIKQPTILHVEDKGADADNPGNNIYDLTLNAGYTVRISMATGTQPAVDTPYPADQFESRFSYLIGQMQFRQSRMYAKRNMYPVPTISPMPDHNQKVDDQSNPNAIASVRTEYDLPSNPTTLIKKVTLVSGHTERVAIGETTIIGKEIGEASGTASLQSTMDVSEWAEIDVIITLAPQVVGDGDETLAGMAIDPWPFWGCPMVTCTAYRQGDPQ